MSVSKVAVVLAAVMSIAPASAQAPVSTPTVQEKAPPTALAEDTPSEVALARYYQERILDTVHWALATSLGLLVTVVVVVVGLGWYTNFRLYRRDLEAIEKRLTEDVEKVARKAATKAATSQVALAMQNIKALQCKMLRLDAERWERDGVTGNALLALAESLQLLKEAGLTFDVADALEEMKRLLKSERVYLHPSGSSTLQHALRKLESEYPAEVKVLMGLIEQVVSED